MTKWVTIKKFCADTGYTDLAVRAKLSQGVWTENVIWRKAPDGRVMINTENFDKWVEGTLPEQPWNP